MRYFILWAGLLFAQPTHPNRAYVRTAQAPFLHAVASGDPLADRVILWTRVTPPEDWGGSTISVRWEVSEDFQFTQIVASGTAETDASRDYTVKVDATGLQPNRWYYYRFEALGTFSPIGRTRTLPSGSISRLRFAVVSCSDYQNGFYNAYEMITRRNDIDFVLHLGDYIYEYGPSQSSARQVEPPREILTLDDYRIRYSHYRLDSSLQWLHQNYPVIAVWDDHELTNDAWSAGAENHSPDTEGPFEVRRAAMLRAYHEWLPFRAPDPADSLRLWRSFKLGDLADLILLDTRHYGRTQQLSGGFINVNDPALNDSNRTLLGALQRQWFYNQLKGSTANWRLIGQQVMVAPMRASLLGNTLILNPDQWDGYPVERQALMDTIIQNNIQNVVVLTGDIHTSWANDLPFGPGPYNNATGAGSTAVEFVTPSVTAANAAFLQGFANPSIVKSQNPHVKYVDLTSNGYLVIDVTPQRVQGDWYYVNTIAQPALGERTGESWYVQSGERFLRRAASPVVAPSSYNPPLVPRTEQASALVASDPLVVGVYPNPAQDFLTLQLYTPLAQSVEILLLTLEGKKVATYLLPILSAGTHYYQVPLDGLAAGPFLLQVKGQRTHTYRLIKR
ncbi:MAG: alkaline phosphatase D family protein [Bacteroidia bacterium]|nr:alkaline phosphatase D family protein [Bacteroidia bacterium]MDW8015888.1 alkaline phosphatase D family protein [Bacteroidia bacterium]